MEYSEGRAIKIANQENSIHQTYPSNMKGDKGFISGVHHHQTGLAKKLNKFKQNKKDAKKHMNTHMVAQRLNHLPAMRETWVRSLGPEDPLEKEMATHSSTLAWRIPWRSLVGYSPRGHKELDTTERLN